MNRLSALVSFLIFACCASSVTAQPNWAERLGFPAGKRVVILHGNDMGIAYEFNRPVQQGLEDGVLTSGSVMSAGAWFADCADWAKSHTDADLGITLSFVSPSNAVSWGPVSSRDEVRSLTTVDGYFPKTVLQLHLRADAEQVRHEAEAQIRRAREMGIQPTHLHPHLGAMLTRADILRVYLDLAEEHWIPAVMVEMTPDVLARLGEQGFVLDEETIDAIAQYRLPKVDDIKDLPPASTYEEKRDQLFQTINELGPGLTQIFLHPCDDTPGARRITDKWQQRVWEAQLLSDPQVQAFLKSQDVVYTNWREIMQRFEAVDSVKDTEDE